jgi:fatty acid desaturase
MLIVDVLLVLSIAFLLAVHVFWLQCLNALVLAVLSAQLGFTGHDAGHRQCFAATWKNDVAGLVHGTLGLGMSFSWWVDKHNAHHARPNELDSDPDLGIPLLAFTREDAAHRRGLRRFIAAHQALFFFPLLALVALELQRASVTFHLRGTSRGTSRFRTTEVSLLVLHYVGYCTLLFLALPWWQALVFALLHKVAAGLYLGSVFAPNHKGMLLTEHGSQLDFLRRQVLTARNVRAHPLVDTWYGGLNYQIEHHLFPSLPRGNLGRAQRIIRRYCADHGVSYHETSMLRSYAEILTFLHEMGAPLRLAQA